MTVFGRLTRNLSGQSGEELLTLLEDQVRAAVEGVAVARLLVTEGGDSALARQTMSVIEHAGDASRASLVSALSRVLVSPLDREDLFRISRSVDDVLDNIRDFVRQWDLFAMTPGGRFGDLLDAVLDGLHGLEVAVALGRRPSTEMTTAALGARNAGNRVRHIYGEALAELLTGEVTMSVLRQRELLRRLDVVGLRLAEALDALMDAAVKRSVL